MKWTNTTYTNSMEILATEANLVTFSATVKQQGTADEHGGKYVTGGSLIDADGNIVTQTGATGSETLSATPVGVLLTTVNVTDGDKPCALAVEGYLRADRVLDGFAAKAFTAIKTALPEIKFI